MGDIATPDGPLSGDEIEQFKALLRRFCLHNLDQWCNFAVMQSPPYGPVRVQIDLKAPKGYEDSPYVVKI